MSSYHLDYETTSQCDISLGAYRYAVDPSTRILMFAAAKGNDAPLIWRYDHPLCEESIEASRMLQAAIKEDAPIYAHNAMFEHAVSRYRLHKDVGLLPPRIEQWRCTRAMALRAAIPSSLAAASAFLGLKDKDAKGKALINIFSDQNKIVTLSRGKERMKSASPILEEVIPWDWTVTAGGEHLTVREAWEQFIDYCRNDVVVEQQIHRKLARFEITGVELEGFQFDLRMNDRGVPVNCLALEHAQKIVDHENELLSREFLGITGLTPSQTGKVLAWLKTEGYTEDDLQAKTMRAQLGSSSLTPQGQRALEIRAALSFAAVKKVKAMLDTACPDSRMRGLLTWHGAQRTGRWTSSGPQVQNAKKPTKDDADDFYACLSSQTDFEFIPHLYTEPVEYVASCVRNFIQTDEGEMLDLDLANIESRVGAWLAGCDSELALYREGKDAYKQLASEVFKVPVEEVTKAQRFVGKVGVLSLVFQTGAKTFFETCATWGQPIGRSLAALTVRTFRETKPEFPQTWRRYEAAAIKAINNPGKWFDASDVVSFARTLKDPFDRLLMRLPSGRYIVYPLPEVSRSIKRHKDFETGETLEWKSDDITFYGKHRLTAQWGRVSTYAGDLFQSSVQATARDIMLHGCLEAQRKGFNIFCLIHDQALAEDGDVSEFKKAFCSLPPWVPSDFPLDAEAAKCAYYSK